MNEPPLYYDEDTLFKVEAALVKSGLTVLQAGDGIREMLNSGILFRERSREETPVGDDQEGAR